MEYLCSGFTGSYILYDILFEEWKKCTWYREIKRNLFSDFRRRVEKSNTSEVYDKAKIEFSERYEKINWINYYITFPFNTSALSLYEWSPIAEELKTLDKKIVLNSMILKWDNVKQEFKNILNF